ncbi:hypothetical protein [Thiobacillus sp.]|nr:hypothetical protein [Thiobacillus sp.]
MIAATLLAIFLVPVFSW